MGERRNNPAIGEVDVHVDDALLAEELAERAGALLLQLRAAGADGRTGDAESDAFLLAELAARRPGDAVLSEESPDPAARHTAERVWIVDPLDGTREFGEAGRTDWAVHVALWERGELACGAIALPARSSVRSSRTPVPPPARERVRRIAVSRTRPPAWAHPVAEELGAELVGMGSAGAKVDAVLRGEVDAYLHDGGQYEWDSAAPVAVAWSPDCTPAASTGPRCVTTSPTRGRRICSSATLEWRTGSSG